MSVGALTGALAALRIDAAVLPEPGPGRDPDTARDRAADILASSEFSDSRTVPERILDWIGARLGDLAEGLGAEGGQTVLGLLVLAALVGLVVLAVWSFRRRVRVARRAPNRPVEPSAVVTATQERDVDWWAEAERARRECRWGDAVRADYRAGAGSLAGAGLVRERPGVTAGEQRRAMAALRADPAGDAEQLSGDFSALAESFEAVWYAGRTADEEQASRSAEVARAVRSGAGHRSLAHSSGGGEPTDA
ncbi:MAG: DUF4129 domain-containing protein [Acidimicrobiales bacterium]